MQTETNKQNAEQAALEANMINTRETIKAFKRDMKNLEQLYKKYQKESGDTTTIPEDDYSLFIEWALHYHEKHDQDLHSGQNESNVVLNNKNCFKATSKDQFLKSFFPDILTGAWPVRFTNKFIKKMGDVKSEEMQHQILRIIHIYTKGDFMIQNSSGVSVKGLSFMTFFKYRISTQNLGLVASVHVERYPEFDKYKKVKAFHYVHVVRFLDILNENDKVTALNTCLAFLEDCKKDPARQECQPKIDEERTKLEYHTNNETRVKTVPCFEKVEFFNGQAIVLSPFIREVAAKPSENSNNEVVLFKPAIFEVNYLTLEEIDELVYNTDIHRWVSKKAYALFLRRQENSTISKLNSEVLEKFADFESSGRLVEILEKMKNLKLKLTSEEKRLIGQGGNVLAIGRSGTGKTTCCVLRLFSQDMLYKLRLAQAQVKHGVLRDTRYMSDQLENLIGIHSIFVSASPVLTNEVRRYYENLSRRIRDEIKRKDQTAKNNEKAKKNSESENQEAPVISEITTEKEGDDQSQAKQEDQTKAEENADNFNEEEYLMDDEEAEAMARMNKNYSFDTIEEKEFPLFLTVKRIIMMIDGTLQQPFFARQKDNSIIGSDTQAQWHNEMKGLMMISNRYRAQNDADIDNADVGRSSEIQKETKSSDNTIKEEEDEEDSEDEYDRHKIDDSDIEAEYERYQAIIKKKKEQLELEEGMRKKNKLSFEVDFEYFFNHFWQRGLSRQDRPTNISPIIIWSEIMSSIKGSAESHLCPGFYIPQEIYCSAETEGTTFLDKKNREKIYEIFMYYEEWKKKECGYDFMDVVNHSLNEIRLRGYNGIPIHFVMIDEVQDLSHATILLLMKITEQNVFFAGDTAQTIAKGVGIRFSDLSSLFKFTTEKELVWKRPTVHQLTVNFRSHGKILDMANSVVSLVETFFPKTIDRLKKEKSEVDGPKPILLEDVDIEVLFAVLFGTENFKSYRHSQNQGSALEKPPIEFGCNQAIIVRDQESKNKLPPLLKHALCLTVYEAKGLEFDDVILYNFFSESPVSSKEWDLLNFIEIENRSVDKDTYERNYFTYKEETLSELRSEEGQNTDDKRKDKDDGVDFQSPNVFNMELDPNSNTYNLKKVFLAKRMYSILELGNYGMLCNELKQLYVSLTRPRNRIIIYDDKIQKRDQIERYWKNLSLVQVVNKSVLANQANEQSSNKDLESFKNLIASTSEADWKKQGLRMFKNKYYEQAVKCFEKSGDKQLHRRAEAYMIAERASNKLSAMKNEESLLLKELSKRGNSDNKEQKGQTKQLRREEKTCLDDYEKAAEIFVELNLLKQAAQCFFSAGAYQRALEIYEKLELPREAGEACFMLKDYERTAELFLRGGDFVRAIECFEKTKDYSKILDILENLKNLPAQQRKYYAQKYVPLALQGLVETIGFESNGKGSKEAIHESSEEEDVEKKIESQEKPNEAIQNNESQKIPEDIKPSQGVDDMSFDVIDKHGKENQSESSFIEIRRDDSKKNASDLSFENVDDKVDNYEHLSQYDMQDEFLKSETGSVMDSLDSLRKDKLAMSSDFSAIDFNYVMNSQYHLVKTKADIFVQDSIMEKIIKYINMFSNDFKEGLQNLRSKEVLLTENSSNTNVGTVVVGHDLADLDFIYFALDFLEQSKLFKLCIFVCNRYNLANKLGRYLVNMAFKYSNFPYEDIRANFFKLFLQRNRQIQQEKAYVSNIALHSVLEIINPKYLKLKKKGEVVDETNSLGDRCFNSLVSLGFWKKCLFLMDYTNSLGLASTFASFENYKLIFLTGSNTYNIPKDQIKSLVEGEGFEFLQFETPSNSDEVKAAIIGLESIVWNLSETFPQYLYKHYKPSTSTNIQITVPKFPSYFVYNQVLWNFIVNRERGKLADHISIASVDLKNILSGKDQSNKVNDLKVFDIVTFFVQIALFYNTNHLLADLINKLDIKETVKLISAYRTIIKQTSNVSFVNRYEETILRGLLSPFRARFIERTSVLSEIAYGNYIVHISSPLVSELILAENTANPALIYDIEGNFVLASISLCLKEIRKKMANVMRTMISIHTRDCLSTSVPVSHEIRRNIQKYLEDRAHIVGMISCHDYCDSVSQGLIRKNSDVKKPSTLKTYAKAEKAKQKAEDEDSDEADNYESMVGAYKERNIKMNSKKVVVSNQQSKSKPDEDREANLSLQSFRNKALKEIKAVMRHYHNFNLNLDYYSKSELLSHGLKKLNKYIQQKKLRSWIVHLFYILDSQVILNEFLRKHKKQFTAEKLQLYYDALYYRKFACSEEYINGTFDYVSGAFKRLSLEDIISVIESLVPYATVANLIGLDYKQASLHSYLLPYIGVEPDSSENQIFDQNITPLYEGGSSHEIFHWISKISERLIREKSSPNLSLRLLKLLINQLANVTELENDSIEVLREAVPLLWEITPINPNSSKRKSSRNEDLQDSPIEMVRENLNSLDALSEKNVDDLLEVLSGEGFVTIDIISDSKVAEKNLEKSEKAWLLDNLAIATRINLKKKLRKALSKKREVQFKEINDAKTNYLLDLAGAVTGAENTNVLEMKKYTLRAGIKMDIFDLTNRKVRYVMNYFGANVIDSPIDFHYISNILQRIADCGLNYVNTFKEGLRSREIKKKIDYSELNRELITKAENLHSDFLAWISNKEQQDQANKKFAKGKKLVRAKWEEEALISKMQQIARKRKGLRKQEIQMRKAKWEVLKKK